MVRRCNFMQEIYGQMAIISPCYGNAPRPTYPPAAFGLTPMRYLASLRVEAAREALAAGASCADAAWAAGFSDQAHLTRAFKERLGMTPGFYQRAIAGADPADALASSPEQVRP